MTSLHLSTYTYFVSGAWYFSEAALFKSEHWAPCRNQTPSWYDWKIVESNVKPEQTNYFYSNLFVCKQFLKYLENMVHVFGHATLNSYYVTVSKNYLFKTMQHIRIANTYIMRDNMYSFSKEVEISHTVGMSVCTYNKLDFLWRAIMLS